MKTIRGFAILLLLVASLLPQIASGGTCTTAAGKVDLNVLFLYHETDLEGWRPVFTAASELLYNATEGHLQIGTVNFYSACQPAKDGTDIWISEGTAGASAHRNGCGVSGQHVFLSNLHKSNDSAAHGQLGLVHELGHYILGLADEYGGRISDATTGTEIPPLGTNYMWQNSQVTLVGGGKAFLCTQASGGTACIMDAGTTVTSAFSRTEFCSPGDHIGPRTLNVLIPGDTMAQSRIVENHQESTHGSDCWTNAAAKLGISTVPDPPSSSPPAGHVDLVFNDIGASARFVLTLDRSGSMLGAPIDLAKAAARYFIDNARLPRMEHNRNVPGDEVGVVSFSDTATVNAPLTEITSQADRDTKKAAVSALVAAGGTSIGGGLRLALNQLLGRGNPGCIEAVILLSDGVHNSGESPASVLPDLVSRGAVVFTVGLGAGADRNLLTSIATATGGRFFFAAGPSDLPSIFAEIQATATGAAILERVKRTLSEGEFESFPILIDPATAGTTFTITGLGFDVTLTSPSGATSDRSSQAPGVTYRDDGIVQTFVVSTPETGAWSLRVVRTAAGAGEVTVVVSASSLGTHLQATAPGLIDFASTPLARLLVEASLSEGPGVVAATVVADVERPDGSRTSFALNDQGQDGDVDRNDGVYSAVFQNFAGDGTYTFTIRADTLGAFLVTGEDGPDAGALVPASHAIRTTTVTSTVVNVPSNQLPTAHAGVDQVVECAGSLGAQVLFDGSGSSDADGDPLTYRWTGPFPEGGGLVTGQTVIVTLPLGMSTVTLVVNDGSLDSDPDSVDVVVADTLPPVITCPSDATGVCEVAGVSHVDMQLATAHDVCGGTTIVNDRNGNGPDGSGSYPLGLTAVTFTAVDDSGLTAACGMTVNVPRFYPRPKKAGYYKRLCNGPYHGDSLTDLDAACAASTAPLTFGSANKLDAVCAVLGVGHDSDYASHDSDKCSKSEDELMALALNLCTDRLCPDLPIDTSHDSDHDTDDDSDGSDDSVGHDSDDVSTNASTVGEALTEVDALFSDPNRTGDTCKNGEKLSKGINSGKFLRITSLRLAVEAGSVRLSWLPPFWDDENALQSYDVWRRPLGSSSGFIRIGTTEELTFVDTSAASGGAWEYDVSSSDL